MSRSSLISLFGLVSILVGGSLTARAAVVGKDRRGSLTRQAVQKPFLFTTAESLRIRNTTGFVYCPGARGLQNGFGSSGFLIGTATDMYVVTVAHAFIDKKGNPRDPLSSCSFTSFGAISERIPLLFNRKQGPTYVSGTFDWVKEPGNDFMIVRLSRPSPEAEPFRLGTPGIALAGLDESRLFAVSATMAGYDSGSEPIVQNCAVRRVFDAHYARPSVAYTDCAAKVGASGSPLFTRAGDGSLVPVAMIQGTKDGEDGLPYDEATQNYTFAVGLDKRVLDLAKQLMGASF